MTQRHQMGHKNLPSLNNVTTAHLFRSSQSPSRGATSMLRSVSLRQHWPEKTTKVTFAVTSRPSCRHPSSMVAALTVPDDASSTSPTSDRCGVFTAASATAEHWLLRRLTVRPCGFLDLSTAKVSPRPWIAPSSPPFARSVFPQYSTHSHSLMRYPLGSV